MSKEKKQNWAIAIILAVAVAVISIAAIFTMQAIPQAKAEVSAITTNNWYVFDSSVTTLPTAFSTTINDTTARITVYWNDGTNTYNYTSSKMRLEASTGTNAAFKFYIYDTNGTSYLCLWYKISTLQLHWFDKYQMNGESGNSHITNGWCKIKFTALVANNNTTITNVMRYCVSTTASPEDNSPIISNSTTNITICVAGNISPNVYTLKAYEVHNADQHTGANDICTMYARTYNTDTDETYNSFVVPLYNISGRYYLLISCPQECNAIEIEFATGSYDDNTTLTYTDNQSIIDDYRQNWIVFKSIMQKNDNDVASSAYNNGYLTGKEEQNNLVDVIWSTLEMPYRILFGVYDNDPNSDTYGLWVGGLFNFEILGLDMRAFTLSVMSLIIVIAIIRLIIGAKGIG